MIKYNQPCTSNNLACLYIYTFTFYCKVKLALTPVQKNKKIEAFLHFIIVKIHKVIIKILVTRLIIHK